MQAIQLTDYPVLKYLLVCFASSVFKRLMRFCL